MMHPDRTLLEHNHLPMGLKIAQDIAQVIIEDMMRGLGIVAYIYDIGLQNDRRYEDHLKLVN